MSIEERREREKEEMRELILAAASDIIAAEGFDGLSIRKIAGTIEYSPAIIYHYFKDKDDIVNHVIKRGYQKIVSALYSVQVTSDQPEKRLKELTRKYINAALQMPEVFKAVQLNSSPAILEYTSSLFIGAAGKKPALGVLYQCLKDIHKDKNIDERTIELTTQIIAAATLGIIIKLIIENNIDEVQKQRLIEHYIDVIVERMAKGESV